MSKGSNPGRAAEELEQLFADLWQVFPFSSMRRGFRPQVDVFRTEDPPELTVVVELPGVDPDTVRLDASERGLVIAGDRPRPLAEGRTYSQMEIDYGPFERHVSLADGVDVAEADASYERGILTVRLPLAARPTPEGPVEIDVRRRG